MNTLKDGIHIKKDRNHFLDVPSLPRDEEGNYLEPIGWNNDPLRVFSIVEENGVPAIHISGKIFGILVTDLEHENFHIR